MSYEHDMATGCNCGGVKLQSAAGSGTINERRWVRRQVEMAAALLPPWILPLCRFHDDGDSLVMSLTRLTNFTCFFRKALLFHISDRLCCP